MVSEGPGLGRVDVPSTCMICLATRLWLMLPCAPAPQPSAALTLRAHVAFMHAGLYVCVESPASATTFTLRGASHSCPLHIKDDGSLELCSGHGAAATCPHGVCTCAAPYAPPSPTIYPGKHAARRLHRSTCRTSGAMGPYGVGASI